MAMYDASDVTPLEACNVGESFFDAIGASITTTGYYTYKNDEDGLHVDWIETSLSDLKSKIVSKEVTAFRLYSEQNGYSP
ncbi:hypothetical protein [Cohnella nanjingensis]|uniref:Uncharacterized protein n=1 Tax=Cohnella nanjingensis TaxID=1387779 RepID=A0A7X0RW51_9BACL|nr:hypothetical protein [Cohnella nanjingensis]MBB6674774.1 hypothetical protein [Cohnella nanjingensis]